MIIAEVISGHFSCRAGLDCLNNGSTAMQIQIIILKGTNNRSSVEAPGLSQQSSLFWLHLAVAV